MKVGNHNTNGWKPATGVTALLIGCFVMIACSSIDCPLNSRVAVVYKLMGTESPLADSLTITTNRFDQSDPVLLNKVVNVDSFVLPISYQRPEDVLFFRRSNATGWSVTDTVVIKKQDTPHFEAVDCNPLFFHEIEQVSHTRLGIDSIVIHKSKVTYDASEPHLYIYFKHLLQ